VNEALDRGAKWLAAQQRKSDGGYPGLADRLDPTKYTPMDVGLVALVALTLSHCGVKADEDPVQRALHFCQYHYSGGGEKSKSWNLKGNRTLTIYTAATLIMALDAVHRKQTAGDAPAVKRDRYGTPIPPSKPGKCEMPSSARNWIAELVDFIVKNQQKDGGWRYPGNSVGSLEGISDLSNTQYALLGLETAARCGIDAPPETWVRAAEYYLREQEDEGIESPVLVENEAWAPGDDPAKRFLEVAKAQARGWTYLPGKNELPTGSMTCAGLAGLAMAKERLWAVKKLTPELQKRIDRGVLDGLAWLAEHFTVEENRNAQDVSQQWHYYYLYGLERVGAKCGVRWIGRNDWYRLGAEHLLAAQTKEGGWPEGSASGKPADHTESVITQTCFALLFLKRATRKPLLPAVPPVVTGGGAAPADGR
jgi:hypothetical protein